MAAAAEPPPTDWHILLSNANHPLDVPLILDLKDISLAAELDFIGVGGGPLMPTCRYVIHGREQHCPRGPKLCPFGHSCPREMPLALLSSPTQSGPEFGLYVNPRLPEYFTRPDHESHTAESARQFYRAKKEIEEQSHHAKPLKRHGHTRPQYEWTIRRQILLS
jgi:hypothetical protein